MDQNLGEIGDKCIYALGVGYHSFKFITNDKHNVDKYIQEMTCEKGENKRDMWISIG